MNLKKSPPLQTSPYLARMFGFPEINSIDDLGRQLRLPVSTINHHLHNKQSVGYKTFFVPKKPNGYRELHSPVRQLKYIQAWILRNILDKLQSSPSSTAFEKNCTIKANAEAHLGKSYVINSDVKDFFPSISAGKVYAVFRSLGYTKEVCWALTGLVTHKGCLPQGSPSSPKIANLVCHRLDSRINGYCKKYNLTYTRYADDMSISTSNRTHIKKTIRMIKAICHSEGFSLRDDKTAVMGRKKSKKITGLVISDEVRIGRKKYRELRAMVHSALKSNDHKKISYINGYMNFLKGTDEKTHSILKKYIESLTARRAPTSPQP